MKIKVLHRAATTCIGGVEKYVMNHYQYIDNEKFQFDFITRNPELSKDEQLKKLGMGVKLFKETEQENREGLIKEINDILDDGYDILHMNTSCWAGFLIEEIAMKRGMKKVIVHSHHSNGIDNSDPRIRKYWMERHAYYKQKFSREYATHFCACSNEAADWLFGNQIPRDEIHILKNAIEIERYTFNRTKRQKLRNELGLLEDNYVIGNVARFSYLKNHVFLINVFYQIYKKNPKAKLLLVGQGELEEQIKNQISQYGISEAVFFMGWREDVNEIMQAMDLFLMPSLAEGLPITLVEAQAAGLPCIVSSNITLECKITNLVQYKELDEVAWIKEIENLEGKRERMNMEKEITAAGYNIKYAAKLLEEFYLC